jgi:hypothetical protein
MKGKFYHPINDVDFHLGNNTKMLTWACLVLLLALFLLHGMNVLNQVFYFNCSCTICGSRWTDSVSSGKHSWWDLGEELIGCFSSSFYSRIPMHSFYLGTGVVSGQDINSKNEQKRYLAACVCACDFMCVCVEGEGVVETVSLYPRLASNPGSSCLSLPSPEITGVYHHTSLCVFVFTWRKII